MSIEAMKQALEELEYVLDCINQEKIPFDGDDFHETLRNLRQAIEQAEKQEPDLPPVFIGVDVTLKGTQVNAFYRRPNDVAEMFYSEFHPLAKPEQESISTNDHLCAMLRQVHDVLACTALPMKRQWVGLTDDEIEEAWGNTPMMLNARDGGSRKMFARAIEAKLKEKNT
jgi:hypothetical protein